MVVLIAWTEIMINSSMASHAMYVIGYLYVFITDRTVEKEIRKTKSENLKSH